MVSNLGKQRLVSANDPLPTEQEIGQIFLPEPRSNRPEPPNCLDSVRYFGDGSGRVHPNLNKSRFSLQIMIY